MSPFDCKTRQGSRSPAAGSRGGHPADSRRLFRAIDRARLLTASSKPRRGRLHTSAGAMGHPRLAPLALEVFPVAVEELVVLGGTERRKGHLTHMVHVRVLGADDAQPRLPHPAR